MVPWTFILKETSLRCFRSTEWTLGPISANCLQSAMLSLITSTSLQLRLGHRVSKISITSEFFRVQKLGLFKQQWSIKRWRQLLQAQSNCPLDTLTPCLSSMTPKGRLTSIGPATISATSTLLAPLASHVIKTLWTFSHLVCKILNAQLVKASMCSFKSASQTMATSWCH